MIFRQHKPNYLHLVCHCLRLIGVGALITLVFDYSVNAEIAYPIVRYQVRPSQVVFPTGGQRFRLNVRETFASKLNSTIQTTQRFKPVRDPAIVSRNSKRVEIRDLPELGECRAAENRRKAVALYSLESTAIDWIYYSPKNALDLSLAKRLGKGAIAYRGGPYYMEAGQKHQSQDSRLLMSWFLGVRCLPTRVHFITDGNQRYFEFREGKNAWIAPK